MSEQMFLFPLPAEKGSDNAGGEVIPLHPGIDAVSVPSTPDVVVANQRELICLMAKGNIEMPISKSARIGAQLYSSGREFKPAYQFKYADGQFLHTEDGNLFLTLNDRDPVGILPNMSNPASAVLMRRCSEPGRDRDYIALFYGQIVNRGDDVYPNHSLVLILADGEEVPVQAQDGLYVDCGPAQEL